MDDSGGRHPGALGGTSAPIPPGSRRQEAGFSIFLDRVTDAAGERRWESRLYHAESGSEAQLPGVSPEDWIRWLVDQLGSVVTEPDRRDESSGAGVDVTSVEILDVVDEDTAGHEERRTITARVMVTLTGLAHVEREIGARILRGMTTSTPPRRPRPR